MASFSAGTTFTDNVANDVTALKLEALVNAATPTSGLIQDRTAESTIAANDTLLFGDFSDSNNLKRMTVANFAGTLPTATITTLNSTTGTIATLNSTTGTIPTLVATTLITTGTGTAAAPAIVPTGDANTGIFFPAADTLAATTNGTERLRIDSSGNVGIGTTPSRKLDVSGVAGVTYLMLTSNTASAPVVDAAITRPADGTLGFITSGTERLRIDSSGNFGIGTNSPLVSAGFTSLTLDGTTSGILEIKSNGTQKGAFFNDGSLTRLRSSGTLAFDANNTEAMRIDSSGGVTIAGLAGSGSRAVNASAAGLLSAASDASLKEEVVGAHIAGLDEILQIHPKMYRWKDDIANRGDEASVELGFIANDVAPIIPSAAPMGNDGLYGFYDRSITAALVKAIQELKAENDSLKSRIEALEAK